MSSANLFARIVLALYVPAIYLAIRRLGARRGVMAALIGGWLFLPVFDGRLEVPLLATKLMFVSTTVLLVSVVADSSRWARLKPHWADLAAAVVAVGPFVTAQENGLGAYEGLSASVQAFCAWVAPYLLGRAYFGTPRALRDLARAMVAAALVYVPLCLWEIRMSPQLHRQLYGYHTFSNFAFAVRFGGYRPTVFMQFGLMVGTFMASGTLIAYWLWRCKSERKVLGLSLGWATALLAATTVLLKSTGAVILLAVGVAVLEATRLLRGPVLILAVALLPPVFAASRLLGWSGRELSQAAGLISVERAESVGFRLLQEKALLDKAQMRPWLGWGRWGRSRVYDEDRNDVSVTDSLWVIALGTTGRVGLIALGLLLLLPTLLLLRRFPARRWDHPALAPAAGLALATVLWVVDCLLNSMISPLFLATCGATVTFAAGRWSRRRRRAAASPRAGERVPPTLSPA